VGDVVVPSERVVSVSVDVVVLVEPGAYVSAYRPRVNGFHVGQTDGSGNSATSDPLRAGSMKSRQISAGKLPPLTAIP